MTTDLAFEVISKEISAGAPAQLRVTVERDVDEDDEPDLSVHAPFFPAKKTENWWLVVGEEASKSLLAIKRVSVARRLETKLEFVVPSAGH